MRALAALLVALAALPPAAAAANPLANRPRLTQRAATRAFLSDAKVADWLDRYPPHPVTDASYQRERKVWTVNVWSGKAGEVAEGTVDDGTGAVLEAWTGPQVAWKMARGGAGAFGGRRLNSAP